MAESVYTKELLKELQSMSLFEKIEMTKDRIEDWYMTFHGNVCVSFSGGKDSTVLLHLVRSMYPDVPAVFSDTGLEYPELKAFVRKQDNVTVIRPKMAFNEVITKYGYPLVGKEVAEAIHYARRILPEDRPDGGEREARNKRAEMLGLRSKDSSRTAEPSWDPHNGAEQLESDNRPAETEGIAWTAERRTYLETARRRSDLTGVEQQPTAFRKQLTGSYPSNEQRTSRSSNGIGVTTDDSTDWSNWRRKCLTGSDPKMLGNSAFTKTKWLPLAQKAPFKISHYCCTVMKKSPLGVYYRKEKRKPYLGTMAEESRLRKSAWLRHGCNAYNSAKKTSQPLSFWTEQDILDYIALYGLEIASVYGDVLEDENGRVYTTGAQRTGCIFCGFGMHLEKGETRFQRLHRTHPKLYDYAVGGGQWIDNPDYVEGCNMEPDAIGWVNWNPKKIWVPDHKGLGMGFVFDTVNEIYGKEMMRY